MIRDLLPDERIELLKTMISCRKAGATVIWNLGTDSQSIIEAVRSRSRDTGPKFADQRLLKELFDPHLSYQRGKGYRKMVGWIRKEDGKRIPKQWWLGQHRETAECAARDLLWQYHQSRENGMGECWTPEELLKAKLLVDSWRYERDLAIAAAREKVARAQHSLKVLGADAPSALELPLESQVAAEPKADRCSLGAAVEEYVGILKMKVPGQLSQPNCNAQIYSLNLMYEVLDRTTPMEVIGKTQLEKLVAYFAARPMRKKTGRRLAADSVVTILKHIRAFFDWKDGNGWDGPKRWDKVFRIRRGTLLTPAEQKAEANGKAVFEPAELKTLYANASDRQRLYLLLGLNCAFTQMDISTLLHADVLSGEPAVIDRIRHKTRRAAVRGRWELWPETRTLLLEAMASTPADEAANPQGLALLTEKGKPLVHDDTNSDAIAQSWDHLLKLVNREKRAVRPLSFKTLRKTAGNAIRNITKSKDIQQIMLAHSRRGMADVHYTGERDFAALSEPLRQFRNELVKAGVFETRGGKKAAGKTNPT